MSQSQPSDNSAQTVETQIPGPAIENAFCEKLLLEKEPQTWLASLQLTTAVRWEAIESRVVEIYRVCYERSPAGRQRDRVLRDFAAYHPRLLFNAKWVQLEMRRSYFDGFEPGNAKERLFRSIANGLRSAGSKSSYTRYLRSMALETARIGLDRVKTDLNSWKLSLGRSGATAAWIREQAVKKTEEILQAYPRLNDNRSRKQLLQLLTLGRVYQASVLIAAKTFLVRERDLQQNSSLNPNRRISRQKSAGRRGSTA